ncbi:MAG: hypothetical protein MMC33_009768 [Icmadophila ericetorum]|nr:hypothetical protein [Icmadophila ericetorum]
MAQTETRTQDFGMPALNETTDSATDDPFAAQRTAENDPFAEQQKDQLADLTQSPPLSPGKQDRRMSKEWDASKVPPSKFQRREGSIYATPGSRDGHVQGSDRDKGFRDKLKEKGWLK